MRILYIEKPTDVENPVKYGCLYNWYATIDPRNIAPAGWHVPTIEEWRTFTDWLIADGYGYEGSGDDVGKAFCYTSTWNYSSIIGAIGNNPSSNNLSGFNTLGSGYRNWYRGTFGYRGQYNIFRSTSTYDSLNTWNCYCYYNNSIILVGPVTSAFGRKTNGYSIRLIKDDDFDTGYMYDNNGNKYLTKKHGTQVWMATDLRTTKYRNGDVIPGTTFNYTNAQWEALTTDALCVYNNDWSAIDVAL
jgi:uncharacterized protein (TIGR02145 family)